MISLSSFVRTVLDEADVVFTVSTGILLGLSLTGILLGLTTLHAEGGALEVNPLLLHRDASGVCDALWVLAVGPLALAEAAPDAVGPIVLAVGPLAIAGVLRHGEPAAREQQPAKGV